MKSLLRAGAICLAFSGLQTVNAQTLTPFHHYTFEGNAAADQGSAGTQLQPEGMPFQTTDRFGGNFKALECSSANVFMQNGTAFQGSFTVSMWYRARDNQNAPYAGFWGIPNTDGGATEYGAHAAFGFNQMEFEGGGRKLIAQNAPLERNSWHQITCVQDTAMRTRSIFLDGVEIVDDATQSYSYAPPAMDAKVVFGRKSGQPQSYRLYGAIDEVMIFNQALTAAQIDSSYRANADLEAPSNPGNVRVQYIAGAVNQLVLEWDLASDNSAVEGYGVILDGEFLGYVRSTDRSRGVANPGWENGDVISYSVFARDWTGNVSDTIEVLYTFGDVSSITSLDQQIDFQLSPNPVSDNELQLANLPEDASISIINAAGQQVMTTQHTGVNLNLDISQLPAGLYTVRVASPSKGIGVERFVRK